MTDGDIINTFVDLKRKKCIEAKLNKKWLDKNPEYRDYLNKRFDEPFSKYSEVISRIYNKILVVPKCKKCGKQLPYRSFTNPYHTWCNQKCQLSDPEFIKNRELKVDKKTSLQKARQTMLERYGDSNYNGREKSKQTMWKKYGVDNFMKTNSFKEKSKQTILERYGVDNAFKSEKIRTKIKQTKISRYNDEKYLNKEKSKQTMLERYGVDNFMKTVEFSKIRNNKSTIQKRTESIRKYYKNNLGEFNQKRKETCLNRYGVDSVSKIPGWLNKCYNTKKKNNTFNTSSIEKQLIDFFNKNKINYIYQYTSDDYPFACDFYFPDKQFYLEIQGTWTHGGHPYNINSIEDQKQISYWKSKNTKFYDNAIKAWTKYDVEKREFASKHNLNWKEIFSMDFELIINTLHIWNII